MKVRKGFAALPAVLFLTVILMLFGTAGRISAEDDLAVTCYRNGSRIGTAMVFDWRAAATTCNNILYDCKGECIGCFHDFDYFDDICIDMSGREFLR